MEYKATLDLTSKIITGFVTVLFLGITGFNIWLMNQTSTNGTEYGAIILVVTIYVFCYLFGPTRYVVGNGKIIIKRPLGDLVLDIKNINNAYLANKESMKWTIRTFGNGGLFGYYGKFRNSTFGNMTWYATKRDNYILLETTDNKKIILTPDDTTMVTEIKKMMNHKIS